jgi:hypothetical protein
MTVHFFRLFSFKIHFIINFKKVMDSSEKVHFKSGLVMVKGVICHGISRDVMRFLMTSLE